MIGEAVAGASALKSAFDMARALKDISEATIRNGAVIELQEKILAAQEAQFNLAKRAEELEIQLVELRSRQILLSRYQLKDFGAGTFAYELKASEASHEPIHRACPTCYQKGGISILQFSHNTEGQDWYECWTCNVRKAFGRHAPRDYNYRTNSDFNFP